VKCIILWGHSGAGKTHARTTTSSLKGVPCVDLGDVVADIKGTDKGTFDGMMIELASRIVACESDEVLIEGHFLPGSESRKWMEQWIKSNGHVSEWVEMSADLGIRVGRLVQDVVNGRPRARERLKHLKRDLYRYGM